MNGKKVNDRSVWARPTGILVAQRGSRNWHGCTSRHRLLERVIQAKCHTAGTRGVDI